MSVATTTKGASPGPATGGHRRHPALRWLAIAGIALVVVSTVRVITGATDLDSSGLVAAALVGAVPIGLAGLGGLWSERAGVVNIGLEGMMVLGTWGAAFGTLKGGPWVGLLFAVLCGMLGAVLHALATVVFGVDHIVSGVAINLLGPGAAAYLSNRIFATMPDGSGTQSPPLKQPPSFTWGWASDQLGSLEQRRWWVVSDVASVLRALVTDLSVVTVLAAVLFAVSGWFLFRTPMGLRLRSCGEAPQAAETLGINVYAYKFAAVVMSGAFAGLAGAFLAMVASNQYHEGQTAGRGFIGLAAMLFGNWRVGGTAAGALLFGYTDGVQLRGGGGTIHAYLLPIAVGLVLWATWSVWQRRRPGAETSRSGPAKPWRGVAAKVVLGALVLVWFLVSSSFPNELTGMLPYVTTLLVLAFASQRLRMPAADGLVYRKGEAK